MISKFRGKWIAIGLLGVGLTGFIVAPVGTAYGEEHQGGRGSGGHTIGDEHSTSHHDGEDDHSTSHESRGGRGRGRGGASGERGGPGFGRASVRDVFHGMERELDDSHEAEDHEAGGHEPGSGDEDKG